MDKQVNWWCPFFDQKKIKVIIVTSGAIALGCKLLKKNKKKLKLKEHQAIAAVGQIELMNLFKKSFLRKKINNPTIISELLSVTKKAPAIIPLKQ